jgi:uncharacterized damage-inducible protein DinB
VALKDSLLFEFDHEMAVTRRVLERVPEGAFAWKPHEKSFPLGGLATHLAQIPHWGTAILEGDSYELVHDPPKPPLVEKTTCAEVLDLFDRHVAEVRRGLLLRSDAELMAPWSLKRSGRVVMSMPKLSALRSFLLHHTIHHRVQMTVYLRLQNVPIPPIYGQTADEQM